MRVHVYKAQDGVWRGMVVPARRAHLPPLNLQAGSKEDFRAALKLAIEAADLSELRQGDLVS